MMYIELINNLALASALLFIAGKFFQNQPLGLTATFKTRIYVGVGAGISGTLFMFNSIHVTNTVLLDLRHIAIVIAAIFGGPAAAIISGTIIGIMQLFMNGINEASTTASFVVMIMGVLMGHFSKMVISRISKYILMNISFVTVSSVVIYVNINNPIISTEAIINYCIIAGVGGIFTYYNAEYLRKSNEDHRSILYYQLIAENSMDLISTHHLDGIFKYVSSSSIKILGYQPEELINKKPFDFYHPDDMNVFSNFHSTITDTSKEYTVTYRFKRKDGEFIWLETTSKAIKRINTNTLDEIICSSRDVTFRKQVEDELMEANNKLHELSNLDGLTEIHNRRSFDDTIDKEWKRTLQNSTPLSIIMFDIDHFKIYNDTYGHQQGDDCIKKVARTAQSILNRPSDFIARYGGEEFAVILPDTNQEGALKVAETIREAIQVLAIPHVNSKVMPVVTITVGVTTSIPTPETNYLQLMICADKALYEAKADGRNRVDVKLIA